jgi:putative ABC transport system permease protein
MNTFSLILKNMRQRALSSVLTVLSVALGVALAIAVIIVHREGDKLFVQSDFGYNLIVGPKGDELRLVLNTSYGLGAAQSSIAWSVYDDLFRNQRQFVRSAIPFLVGDTWQGKRIMATSNRIVNSPELEAFRKSIRTAGESVRALARPAKESDEQKAARLAKVPAAVDELETQLASLRKMGDGLDEELLARIRESADSVARARGMIDPANPAMTDAAGMIASDAIDQIRMLDSFSMPFEYRSGRGFELAQGRAFHAQKFEGVVGSKVADQLKMSIGTAFHLEHGGDQKDVHSETWKVVGILQPTATAMDDVIFIPLTTGWAVPAHTDAMEQMAKLGMSEEQIDAIKAEYKKAGESLDVHEHEHDEHADHDEHDEHDHADHDSTTRHADELDMGLIQPDAHADEGESHAEGEAHAEGEGHHHEHAYHMDGDRIHLELPEKLRKISGVFVTARGEGFGVQTLMFRFRNLPDAMAVSPATQMAQFFNTFMKGPTYVVLGLAILVTAVAAVSILVSIYNAVSARKREIAILRALGATRGKVLALICLEAMLVGLIGAAIGMALGHGIAAVGGTYLQKAFGQELAFMKVSPTELLYALGVVLMAGLAGLVPAWQAYRTSVATNLSGE